MAFFELQKQNNIGGWDFVDYFYSETNALSWLKSNGWDGWSYRVIEVTSRVCVSRKFPEDFT